MWKSFEKRKQLIAKCYLIMLAVTALLFKTLVFRLTNDFEASEMVMFWKNTPWTLTPMLICSVIAAYFIDRGYGKTVGTISLFVILTSAVIVSGSMIWMATEYRHSGIECVQLYGYQTRIPVALFFFADSFMKGGAVGLSLSTLAQTRMSKDCDRDIRYMSLSTIITIIFASALRLMEPQLSWSLIALCGALFILLTIPSFFCYKCLDYSFVGKSEPNNEQAKEKRNWLLATGVFTLCIVTIYSYWKYTPYTWQFYNFRFYGFSLIISLIAFVVSMIILAKRSCKNTVLTGSIILLFALPLCALFFDERLFDLMPAILMGAGLAMIVSPTIGSVVRIPVRMYALTWVGIAACIKVSCNLMFRVFNSMEHAFNTTTIAVYIIYPLLVIALMVLGNYLSSQQKRIVNNE